MKSLLLIMAGASLLHILMASIAIWRTPVYENPGVVAQNALDDEAMFRGAIWLLGAVVAIGAPLNSGYFLLALLTFILLIVINVTLWRLNERRVRNRTSAPS